MKSPSDGRGNGQTRTYDRTDSVVFLKTKEAFGGLSNMAGGFPLEVNGIRILTSEALYQACRFPHMPEVQRLIIEQRSPMTAKMKSKPYRRESRPDWDQVRVQIMRWCLRVKLVQNWSAFSKLLLETKERPIVEQSRKDGFWGAKPMDGLILVGMNVLGRLLMELREFVKADGRDSFLRVEPLGLRNFLLGGRPIETVMAPDSKRVGQIAKFAEHPSHIDTRNPTAVQGSLFAPPAVKKILSPEYVSESSKRPGLADLKSYPAMKDSGVLWLGEVPDHWQVRPNRALFQEVKTQNCPDEPLLSVTISKGVIRQTDLLSDTSKKDSSNLDKSKYKLVKPGEIAYNKMRAWQGAIGASDYQGIISPAYIVMRPRDDNNPRYFHYLYRTPHFAKEAERWSYGITSDMWSLRAEHFKVVYTAIPSREEQDGIVRFLEFFDRRINRLIRAKRRLIELLNEQKKAVINRAVTRGLDPNVRLKPSGIDWLGDVPEHWDVAALGHRYFQCLGKMLDSKRITGNHSLPYLRNTDVQWDRINIEDLPTMDILPAEYDRYTVQQGDLLVCEGGEVGRCAIWSGELVLCGFQKALHRLRPRSVDRDVPRFMYYALRAAAKGNAFSDGHISTIAHLTGDKLRAHRFPFPPFSEQEMLVSSLDSASKQTDQAASTALRQIGLLREYRTRLIADVVTGKLDVRGVEFPALDETEEPDDLEADKDAELETVDDLEENVG